MNTVTCITTEHRASFSNDKAFGRVVTSDSKESSGSTMDYINPGKTGLKVSRICLGCMTYGAGDQPSGRRSPRVDLERARWPGLHNIMYGRRMWGPNESRRSVFVRARYRKARRSAHPFDHNE
jgi:hypothetical protein